MVKLTQDEYRELLKRADLLTTTLEVLKIYSGGWKASGETLNDPGLLLCSESLSDFVARTEAKL